MIKLHHLSTLSLRSSRTFRGSCSSYSSAYLLSLTLFGSLAKIKLILTISLKMIYQITLLSQDLLNTYSELRLETLTLTPIQQEMVHIQHLSGYCSSLHLLSCLFTCLTCLLPLWATLLVRTMRLNTCNSLSRICSSCLITGGVTPSKKKRKSST